MLTAAEALQLILDTAIKLTARAHTVTVHCTDPPQCILKATNLELGEGSSQLLSQAPHMPVQV